MKTQPTPTRVLLKGHDETLKFEGVIISTRNLSLHANYFDLNDPHPPQCRA